MAALNWNQPGRKVFDFIRAPDPRPGATTTFKGEQVKLYNASFLMDDHTATPGEILAVTDKGIKVAVSGAALLITRFRTKDLGKVKTPEFVRRNNPAPATGSGPLRSCGAADGRPPRRAVDQVRGLSPASGQMRREPRN